MIDWVFSAKANERERLLTFELPGEQHQPQSGIHLLTVRADWLGIAQHRRHFAPIAILPCTDQVFSLGREADPIKAQEIWKRLTANRDVRGGQARSNEPSEFQYTIR